MNKKITYLIFGVLLLTLRLIFNFKFELIPGINGGYYPLQVRTLIETGHLGFSEWTAWQLKTKTGQDKSVDKNTFLKYKKVINLVQVKGINQMHPGEKSPFHEPYFPTERKPFYHSVFFRATELKKQDMKNSEPPSGNNNKSHNERKYN